MTIPMSDPTPDVPPATPATDPWREAARAAAEEIRTRRGEQGSSVRHYAQDADPIYDAHAPLREEMERLREELRWRPCRDSLPPADEKVLVRLAPSGGIDTATLLKLMRGLYWDNPNWHQLIHVSDAYVTHWLPLSAIPGPNPEDTRHD